jgi:hypothetical protein
MIATVALSISAVVGSAAVAVESAGALPPPVYPVAYGNANNLTHNGTVTLTRSGLTLTVTIHLSTGSVFGTATPNLQLCASTSPFTKKVSGVGNCTATPHGTIQQYTKSGSTATVTMTLPAAFTSVEAYLQVHVNTKDGSTANTSFGCPIKATPLYGSCNLPDPTPAPLVSPQVGVVALALVVLGGAAYLLRRRRVAAKVPTT